ncbi:hypothetical protein HDU77_000714, partial [Chytriomyces hyalinus]
MPSQQAQPTSTPATAAESKVNNSVEIDEYDRERDDNDNYELEIIEHNLNRMADYNPLQGYSTRPISRHTNVTKKLKEGEGYAVSYIQQDGTKKTVYAKDGWNLLDLAHSNNIELE